MGFCLFNNVAVAAQHAIDQLGVRRVFILDWDVHHGNGTAEIFRGRDDVLFASIHQGNIYPGSGALRDAGSGAGVGYTINLPIPAGPTARCGSRCSNTWCCPQPPRLAPELVLISAGFDAHRADPLGDCRLESSDFARMARQVRDLAQHADAPIGAVLEGGYDPPALAESVIATMRALSGDEPAESIAPDPSTPAKRPRTSGTTGTWSQRAPEVNVASRLPNACQPEQVEFFRGDWSVEFPAVVSPRKAVLPAAGE